MAALTSSLAASIICLVLTASAAEAEGCLEAACRLGTEQIAQARQKHLAEIDLDHKRTAASIRHATVLNTTVLIAAALIVLGTLWLH